MNFQCPYCEKKLNMDEIIENDEWKAIIKLMTSFGQEGALVLAYLELFGVTPFSKHKKKILVILKEMKLLIDAERFRYRKTEYDISRKGITEALNVIVHRHFTDRLENHNYLKKIMIGISEHERTNAGQKAEEELRRKEESLAHGVRDEAEREKGMRHIGDIIKSIG